MEANAAEILLIIVAIIGLVFCLVAAAWVCRLWTNHSLYLKDFEKLSTQARTLSDKTLEVREDVDRDTTAAKCIKITNQEFVNSADEWDNGIQIALAAWEDYIEMQQPGYDDYSTDPEKQPKTDVQLAKQRKKHAKFMIKFMRAKALEGLKKREELSVQLERIHMAVKTRSVYHSRSQDSILVRSNPAWYSGNQGEAAQGNRRLSDGREIQIKRDIMVRYCMSVLRLTQLTSI